MVSRFSCPASVLEGLLFSRPRMVRYKKIGVAVGLEFSVPSENWQLTAGVFCLLISTADQCRDGYVTSWPYWIVRIFES
jgi:hypothetical protein